MTIRTKLLLTLIALSTGILLSVGIFSTYLIDDYLTRRLVQELRSHSFEIEYLLQTERASDSTAYTSMQRLLKSLDMRLTLISAQGKVTFESDLPESSLSTIENHLQRPEVQQALTRGSGTTMRHSSTTDADMMYFARKIDAPVDNAGGFGGASIIRLGVPIKSVRATMSDIAEYMMLTIALVLCVVILISFLIAQRVSSPLREMERIASQIRAGELGIRLPVRSRDEIGTLCGTLNSMIDTLNDDISKLKKLERFRSEFLGNVSHELRTPIFALQASLETLIGGAVNDPAVNVDFLDKALKNAQRLDDLLSDLIEISRIESGDMKMSYRYFSAMEFIRQVVAEVQPQADKKSISIDIQQSGDATDIFGDRDRIKQALVNLLTNAVKYTDGGGRITVGIEVGGAGARLSITDTGCGIAPEHLPRIFERFYRVDSGRSRDVGGTGLGLAIVKHIVEAHGSRVDVKSEVGKGSTFSFILRT